MFPGKDRVRFLSRVKAMGPDWIEFERPLTYDVRLKWKVGAPCLGLALGACARRLCVDKRATTPPLYLMPAPLRLAAPRAALPCAAGAAPLEAGPAGERAGEFQDGV